MVSCRTYIFMNGGDRFKIKTYFKMKVLYDLQAFDMQTHGGVSRCFAELYSHRPAFVDAHISVKETDNVYLQELGFPPKGTLYKNFLCDKDTKLKHFLFKLKYNIKYGKFSRLDKRPLINLFETESVLKKGDFDIFHPTFFDDYFLPFLGKKPFVITVHDMIPEIFSIDKHQVEQKLAIIPKATHIVAVSERTKQDLVRIMHVPEEKVSVIYHGSDEEPYTPSTTAPIAEEYILFVGTRYEYKNFKAFCKSCVGILKRHPQLKIVCTGVPFSPEEIQFFESLGIKERIVHKFVQTSQELLDLYHYAFTFVYPSKYEGFGIPILEAYKADCPVMLNRASCFPEIAGDAAVFFDLNSEKSDFEEQFETLYRLTGDERGELIQRQRERMKLYSWSKSAAQLADVYKDVLKNY